MYQALIAPNQTNSGNSQMKKSASKTCLLSWPIESSVAPNGLKDFLGHSVLFYIAVSPEALQRSCSVLAFFIGQYTVKCIKKYIREKGRHMTNIYKVNAKIKVLFILIRLYSYIFIVTNKRH